MQFGLFGSASARRGSGEFDSTEGFHDFIEYSVEAEALGFYGTFVVEHHFTGYGQVSATLIVDGTHGRLGPVRSRPPLPRRG